MQLAGFGVDLPDIASELLKLSDDGGVGDRILSCSAVVIPLNCGSGPEFRSQFGRDVVGGCDIPGDDGDDTAEVTKLAAEKGTMKAARTIAYPPVGIGSSVFRRIPSNFRL